MKISSKSWKNPQNLKFYKSFILKVTKNMFLKGQVKIQKNAFYNNVIPLTNFPLKGSQSLTKQLDFICKAINNQLMKKHVELEWIHLNGDLLFLLTMGSKFTTRWKRAQKFLFLILSKIEKFEDLHFSNKFSLWENTKKTASFWKKKSSLQGGSEY